MALWCQDRHLATDTEKAEMYVGGMPWGGQTVRKRLSSTPTATDEDDPMRTCSTLDQRHTSHHRVTPSLRTVQVLYPLQPSTSNALQRFVQARRENNNDLRQQTPSVVDDLQPFTASLCIAGSREEHRPRLKIRTNVDGSGKRKWTTRCNTGTGRHGFHLASATK